MNEKTYSLAELGKLEINTENATQEEYTSASEEEHNPRTFKNNDKPLVEENSSRQAKKNYTTKDSIAQRTLEATEKNRLLIIIFILELAVGISAAVYKADFQEALKDNLKKSMEKEN
ncbi:hypothetical protein JTB14_017039 [Gonioctena quinquepunctata]|nr:hypothetical protein JTB14_017039 [Gonioctena quinquepunctata]